VRRLPLAFLILGILSLLMAGAVVLGVAQSPTTTDLTVHNSAGETLGASRVLGHFTASYLGADVVSFDYTPGAATEVAHGPHGAIKAKRTVTGAHAVGILEPVQALLTIERFTRRGSLFQSTEPVADLVPTYERALVKGSYRTEVRIAGGYVVAVQLAINAVENGQKITETVDYHLTSVGSWGDS
jgi:hypothetical protein